MKHETIVTFGIRPDHASTRFGYLEAGKALKESSKSCPFFEVKRFVEKPDEARAKKYLKSGKYSWNAGIFLWKTGTFLREAKRLKPELATFIEKFSEGEMGFLFERKISGVAEDLGGLCDHGEGVARDGGGGAL